MPLFANVLADCGVALYPFTWWRSISIDEWTQLLEDACAAEYPWIDEMRELFLEYDASPGVRAQHAKVYDWFQTVRVDKSAMNYLRLVPADIYGIIHGYLSGQYRHDGNMISGIMGMRHSYDDEPAVIEKYQGITIYTWYNNGVLQRGDNKPISVNVRRMNNPHVVCTWNSGLALMCFVAYGSARFTLQDNYGQIHIVTEEHVKLLREMWVRFRTAESSTLDELIMVD